MIDLSNLSQEKRAVLKANPGLLKSLERAIPTKIQSVNRGRNRRKHGKSKIQRELQEIDEKVRAARQRAEEARGTTDENLREINRKWLEIAGFTPGDKQLVCPVCGEPSGAYTSGGKPNKQYGKPWCLKCNSPLVPKDKLAKWRKMPKVKEHGSFKDEFKRRGLDF